MPDDTNTKRSLSEISHLFLTSVREKATLGMARPRRIPPGAPRLAQGASAPVIPAGQAVADPCAAAGQAEESEQFFDSGSVADRLRSIDMTPDEYVRTYCTPPEEQAGGDAPEADAEAQCKRVHVSAVLAAHFNDGAWKRAAAYAGQLAADGSRIGVIAIEDAGVVRLALVESAELAPTDVQEQTAHEISNGQELASSLAEMNWDVDRWLVVTMNLRTPEARGLLGSIDQWTLLSTCDHDGVVSSYRTLKGLSQGQRARLSLAVLESADAAETERVYRKLHNVCGQFLKWELHPEAEIDNSNQTVETQVLCYRPADEAHAADTWGIVDNFLQSVKAELPPAVFAKTVDTQEEVQAMRENYDPSDLNRAVAENAGPRLAGAASPHSAQGLGSIPFPVAGRNGDGHADVIDLPSDSGAESILGAILSQSRGELIECPLRAPMCESARLAITRERGMILLAVAREGLSELHAIGKAYHWISENRQLIAMAMPQFAIDPARMVQLRLLVDHADASAAVLHKIMQADHVSIQAYRKLRWGNKTGLFLEAA